jgi:site-specific recombinase XerC
MKRKVNLPSPHHVGYVHERARLVDARREAGLPEALVLYCPRHTYASDALARTGNMAAVMDTMGHANVQTTMIYQHQGLEQIRGAINLRNKENQMRIKSCATEEIFEILVKVSKMIR